VLLFRTPWHGGLNFSVSLQVLATGTTVRLARLSGLALYSHLILILYLASLVSRLYIFSVSGTNHFVWQLYYQLQSAIHFFHINLAKHTLRRSLMSRINCNKTGLCKNRLSAKIYKQSCIISHLN